MIIAVSSPYRPGESGDTIKLQTAFLAKDFAIFLSAPSRWPADCGRRKMPKTLALYRRRPAAKIVMFREAPTSQTSHNPTAQLDTNHARRSAIHVLCGTPLAVIELRENTCCGLGSSGKNSPLPSPVPLLSSRL